MGIYVPNLKMPKSCYNCYFAYYDSLCNTWLCKITNKTATQFEREESCVLEYFPKYAQWVSYSPVTCECSNCGYLIADWKINKINFCPKCGCYMEEREDK